MLMALEIPLPKQIFGHPCCKGDEGRANLKECTLCRRFGELFGVDAVRYFVLHDAI